MDEPLLVRKLVDLEKGCHFCQEEKTTFRNCEDLLLIHMLWKHPLQFVPLELKFAERQNDEPIHSTVCQCGACICNKNQAVSRLSSSQRLTQTPTESGSADWTATAEIVLQGGHASASGVSQYDRKSRSPSHSSTKLSCADSDGPPLKLQEDRKRRSSSNSDGRRSAELTKLIKVSEPRHQNKIKLVIREAEDRHSSLADDETASSSRHRSPSYQHANVRDGGQETDDDHSDGSFFLKKYNVEVSGSGEAFMCDRCRYMNISEHQMFRHYEDRHYKVWMEIGQNSRRRSQFLHERLRSTDVFRCRGCGLDGLNAKDAVHHWRQCHIDVELNEWKKTDTDDLAEHRGRKVCRHCQKYVVVECRTYPRCRFGRECSYWHPLCRKGSQCTNASCPDDHPFGYRICQNCRKIRTK